LYIDFVSCNFDDTVYGVYKFFGGISQFFSL
jgi:hypothetical protein